MNKRIIRAAWGDGHTDCGARKPVVKDGKRASDPQRIRAAQLRGRVSTADVDVGQNRAHRVPSWVHGGEAPTTFAGNTHGTATPKKR